MTTPIAQKDSSLNPATRGFTRRESKDAAIYTHLYTAIVEHHLEPGTKLPEDVLAENYGVSRTSIRKVLQKLSHDKLVDIRMHQGASVAQPSLKEARDLFATRRIIESAAISMVMKNMNDEKLQKLELIQQQEHEAAQLNDRRRAIYLSGRFHVELIKASGNDVLSDTLEDLVARTSLVIATFGVLQSCSCPPTKHQEILVLLRNQDVKQAQIWMTEHLLEIERNTIIEREGNDPLELKDILNRVKERPIE